MTIDDDPNKANYQQTFGLTSSFSYVASLYNRASDRLPKPEPTEISRTGRFWGMPADITEFIRCMAERHNVSLYYTSLESSGFFRKTKTGQFTYSGPTANVEAFGRAFETIRAI